MNLHELMLAIDNKEVDKSQSLLFELIKQYKSDPNVLNTIFNDNYLVGTIRAIFKRDLVDPIFIQFIEGFSLSHSDIYSLLLIGGHKVSASDFEMLFEQYDMNYTSIFDLTKNEDSNYSFMSFLKPKENFYSALKKYGFLQNKFKSSSQFMNQLARHVITSDNYEEYFTSFYQEYGRRFLRIHHESFIYYGKKEQYEGYMKFLLSLGRVDKHILLNDMYKNISSYETEDQNKKGTYFLNYLENIILNQQLHQDLKLHKKENVKKIKI